MSEEITNIPIPETHPKNTFDFSNLNNFAQLAKLTVADLRKTNKDTLFFSKFTKEDIIRYLKNPDTNEKNLRNASIYLYNASSHYKRLIQYFAKLSLLQYIVVPYKLNNAKINEKIFLIQYQKVLNVLENMNIKHEFIKVLTTVYREDAFFGYEYSTSDSYFIRKLNPDFCRLSSIEDGVYNFAFDLSFFDSRQDKLIEYGQEFIDKYYLYKGNPNTKLKGNSTLRWQELSSENTICIKSNEDFDYLLPPFTGIFESIYDIQDYKLLKKSKSENDNYKILDLVIPTNKDNGNFLIDEQLALKYYHMLEKVVPEGIGIALSPMPVNSFSFQSNSTADKDAVEEATSQMWSSAGVSSLIFNNTSAGSTGLTQSIRSDFDIASSLVRQIERWINRKLKNLDLTYKFKIQFLDTTRYNQEEMFDMYLKAGNSGLPVKNALASILGYSPSDTMSMAFLETNILHMRDDMFAEPLLSSSTMSPDSEGGKPKQDTVSESGQKTRDTNGNDR